jgi:CPA1 family monovalent cation:H+ antiporter
MTVFALLSSVVCLAALFGFVSDRLLRLPSTVGTMVLSLALSLGLLMANGNGAVHGTAQAIVGRIDFNRVVLHGMLAFLLFAGALHLDLTQLRREKLTVFSLAVVSTALSTGLVAALVYGILNIAGLHESALVCLLFGALISPTDPIAVLEMLRRVGAPRALEARLAGESLFNDGVAAALFLALLQATTTGEMPSLGHFTSLLLLQAGGGLGLGLGLGWIAYRLLRTLDNYRVEVMLTLALAMGGYALADALHVSAPLEVIAAGILVNGRAREFAMSAKTRSNVETFWELLDEIMNLVLFLLLGLQLLLIPLDRRYLLAAVLTIAAVLCSRWASVAAVLGALRLRRNVRLPGSVRILTWGGLRGGLSVALALALPRGPARELILAITYGVVVFSILVQGLTVGPLLRWLRLEAC